LESRFTLLPQLFMDVYQVAPVNPYELSVAPDGSKSPTFYRSSIDMVGNEPLRPEAIRPGPVGYARFDGALVCHNPRYAAVIHGDRFFIPPRIGPGPWQLLKGGGSPFEGRVLAQHEDRVTLFPQLRKERIPRGLFIGSRSPHVWAHWIVNFVATAHFAYSRFPELDDLPLLVPEAALTKSTLKDSLELAIGNRKTIPLKRNHYARVDELYWIQPPVYDTPLALDHEKREPLHISVAEVKEFADFITAKASTVSGKSEFSLPTKVFLARGNRHSRQYNQEELIAIAERYGFRAVWPEDLSFVDQVRLFSGARHIIGPLGSGLTGIVFCRSDCQILCWSNELAVTENYLANLAMVAGTRLQHLLVTSEGQGPGFYQDYVLRPDFFIEHLELFLSSNH